MSIPTTDLPSRLAKLSDDLHDLIRDCGKNGLGYNLSHDLLQQAESHVRFAYQAACMSEALDHHKHRYRVMTEVLEPSVAETPAELDQPTERELNMARWIGRAVSTLRASNSGTREKDRKALIAYHASGDWRTKDWDEEVRGG